jgi:FkbM family methyltransferase
MRMSSGEVRERAQRVPTNDTGGAHFVNPINLVKSLIPAGARRSLKRTLGLPQHIDEDWKILAPTGPNNQPHVVFDVGAFRGKFIHAWRKWCPLAEVHAFEPSQEAVALLREEYGADPKIKINPTGVGDAIGELEYHVNAESRSCNSFLPADEKTWDEARYRTGAVSRRTAPVTTLDAYCEGANIKSIHLIKIDVQGFELKVLRGASTITLPRTSYLLVESGIRPFYIGAPRFSDVFDYVTGQGFHLIGMRSYHRGNLTLMEADMLFRRDDLMPPVAADQATDKFMTRIG